MTCLDDFQLLSRKARYRCKGGGKKRSTYASALKRDRIALLRLHVPYPILWEVQAARNKEEIDLAICSSVEVMRVDERGGSSAPGGLSM